MNNALNLDFFRINMNGSENPQDVCSGCYCDCQCGGSGSCPCDCDCYCPGGDGD